MGSSQSKRTKKLEARYLAQLQHSYQLPESPDDALNLSQATIPSEVNRKEVRRRKRPIKSSQWKSHYDGNVGIMTTAAAKKSLRQSERDLYRVEQPSPANSSLYLPQPQQHQPTSPLLAHRQHKQQQQQQQLFSASHRAGAEAMPLAGAEDDAVDDYYHYYDVAPCCRRLLEAQILQQEQQPIQAFESQQQQQLRRRRRLRNGSSTNNNIKRQPRQLKEKLNPYYIAAASTPEAAAMSGPNHHHHQHEDHHALEARMDQMFLQEAAATVATATSSTATPTDTTSSSTTSHNQTPLSCLSSRLNLMSTTRPPPPSNLQQYSNSNSSSSNSNNKVADIFEQMFHQPRHQLGLAYSQEQRKEHGLVGLLPPAIQDQDTQVRAVINFIDHCQDELGKYIYLRHLKDYNERLFYRVLTKNVEKLMPLVYTPTVGLGCQKFSEIYMRPRGLFISLQEQGQVASVLANWKERDVRVIVVTDGERILGLGDLGANGMGISIGKLSLYTALAGIPPQNVLPITIDVGTNNEQLLQDPFYIGLRQQRLRGERYEALIDEFMKAVVDRWGRSCLIQFEDFGNSTAFNLLKRYRDHYCTFNDDIQGTASVCLSGLLSAAKLIGKRLRDCSFLFYGAGEANLGTANLLMMAMVEEGASRQEALKSIWLVDSKGLVVKSRTDLSSHKLTYAQDAEQVRDLGEIVTKLKPSAIIGASAQGGAFDETICRKMAQFNERPIIFALSNPTSKAECTADQAYRWTDGRCVFASGSPFEPVEYDGKRFITGQGNNAYIFPGVGLAAIAAHVHTIPEETFLVAARALSDQLTPGDTQVGLVYPKLSKIREVTLQVAMRVLEYFYAERLATYRPEPTDKLTFLRGLQFDGSYEA